MLSTPVYCSVYVHMCVNYILICIVVCMLTTPVCCSVCVDYSCTVHVLDVLYT